MLVTINLFIEFLKSAIFVYKEVKQQETELQQKKLDEWSIKSYECILKLSSGEKLTNEDRQKIAFILSNPPK